MKLSILNKSLRNLTLLVCFTFLSVVLSSNIVIGQNYLDASFGSDYYSKMLEADRFYKQSNLQKVKQIQRQVKPEFEPVSESPQPLGEAKNLPPDSQQYWLTANQALAQNLTEKDVIKDEILKPLENLVEASPEFVPGHILLADTQFKLLSKEKKGLEIIERASELYPGRDDVLDKKIELLLAEDKPLEASIAARQFAYSYPDYYKSSEYEKAADEYYQQFQEDLKSQKDLKIIGGTIGQAATGNEAGAINLGSMLLSSESEAGQSLADDYKSKSVMVSNADKLKYINDIGQKLASLMGREEFAYEFNIVEDPNPNAFALPGGKIFIHTGMLQLMDSEAELAGLLSHEIAHFVLSHGYKKLADSALVSVGGGILSELTGIGNGFMDIGGMLLNKEFSRDKEKEADILGLRVLDAADYSADGLYNVMAKLKQLEGESNFATSLLSTHPASEERMRYLEELIQTKGYNRYAYEGVEAYRQVFPN